jgi:hypothetical protein
VNSTAIGTGMRMGRQCVVVLTGAVNSVVDRLSKLVMGEMS